MLTDIIQDGIFAAIAAIGFAAISRPPKRAFLYCGIIAAVGHASRYVMINAMDWHIIVATSMAAVVIGVLAVIFSAHSRVPPETYLYPSLLPMIPGIYAYKFFGATVMCLYHQGEASFDHYFYLLSYNGLTCFFILLGMVVGSTIPMFLMSKIAFTSTRSRRCD